MCTAVLVKSSQTNEVLEGGGFILRLSASAGPLRTAVSKF